MNSRCKFVISEVARNLRISLPFSIIIELISSLQIIHIHTDTIIHSAGKTDVLFEIDKYITLSFENSDLSQSNINFIQFVWVCFACYFTLHICLLIIVFKISLKNADNTRHFFLRIVSVSYLAHSRIVFFLAHYFFIKLIYSFDNFETPMTGIFVYKEIWLGITVCLCAFNLILSWIKEILLYEIVPNKRNTYAVKNNLFHKITLSHKTLMILLQLVFETTSAYRYIGSSINIFIICLCLIILFTKLPFYNIYLLKVSIGLTGTSLYIAIISALEIAGLNKKALVISLLILIPFFLKLLFIQFNRLSEKILEGDFVSPKKAIHLVVMLKHNKFGYIPSSFYETNPSIDTLISSGALFHQQMLNSDIKLAVHNKKEYEKKHYMYIAERLSQILERFPNSELLLFFTAHLYLKKLGNIARALLLIRRLATRNLSAPARNSMATFNYYLGLIQTKESDSDKISKLKLVDYFEERTISNLLKNRIQSEVIKHIEFWKVLRSEKVDVQKVMDIATEIDFAACRIAYKWKNMMGGHFKHLSNPVLMYGIYLDIVQEESEEAKKMLKRFWNLGSGKYQDKMLDVYSDQTAVVLVSIEKPNVGHIIDASGSTQAIFGINRKGFIGDSVGCFFPDFFAKNVVQFIDEYSRKPTETVVYHSKLYAKSPNGDFFEVGIEMKLYPEFSQQLKAILMFEKLSIPKPMLIVDSEGIAFEYSKSLQQILVSDSKADNKQLINLLKICPEFLKVNMAFNQIYKPYGEPEKIPNVPTETSNIMLESSYDQLHKHDPAAMQKKFIDNWLHSKIRTNSSKSLNWRKDNQNQLEAQSLEDARRICKEFQQGSTLKFMLERPEIKIEVDYEVQICPLQLHGEAYKLLSVFLNKKPVMSQDLEEKTSPKVDKYFLSTECLEVEKSSEAKAFNRVNHTVFTKKKFGSQLEIRGIDANPRRSSKQTTQNSLVVDRQNHENHLKIIVPETKPVKTHGNSLSSSGSGQLAHFKALKRRLANPQSYPLSTRISWAMIVIMVFFVMLAGVSFFISRAAISRVNTGVSIINVASLRLSQAMRAWQLATRFFLIHRNIISLDIHVLKNLATSTAIEMTKRNQELIQRSSSMVDSELLSQVFQNDIDFYDPSEPSLASKKVDTFVATDLIAEKMLFIGNTTENLDNPNVINQIQYVANNTGNDYFIYSEKVIDTTQSVLQRLIANNISNLQVILIFQVIAVAAIIPTLGITFGIILQSYRILLRTLTKIDERKINLRLKQLQLMKVLLEEDLDTQNFRHTAMEIWRSKEISSPTQKAKHVKKTGLQMTDANIQTREMIKKILKHIFFSLLVVQSITGLFIGSLIDSMSNFTSLESANNQLSVTAQAQYQTSAIISTFYIEMLWRNDTSMLVRNELPRDQVLKIIRVMRDINENLVSVFSNQKGESLDPLIEELFESRICKYLEVSLQNYCDNATANGELGLLGVNSKLFTTARQYIDLYFSNPTYDNAKSFISPYAEIMRPSAETLEGIYGFINSYILNNVIHKIENFNVKTIVLHLGILLAIMVSTFVMFRVSIKRLNTTDACRGKVLRALSLNILLEDKVASFYLNKHFKNIENSFGKIM